MYPGPGDIVFWHAGDAIFGDLHVLYFKNIGRNEISNTLLNAPYCCELKEYSGEFNGKHFNPIWARKLNTVELKKLI